MNAPWHTPRALDPNDFVQIRQRTIFDCCKWDPQVEDTATLCPFPLILAAEEWQGLASRAERLARETLAAELELVERPRLHRHLGLPGAVRRVLRRGLNGWSRGAARLIRFDFHYTEAGWRISEANTDVPGGLNEASGFTRIMAENLSNAATAGDPAADYADAITKAIAPGGLVALAHATAYSDDRQVMVYLARELEARGLRTCLASPEHLRWCGGRANICADWFTGAADFVVRFFPAEWLPNLRSTCGWPHFFYESQTPISNPASAVLTQSKRFPLVWDSLSTPLPTWRAHLPETFDPREVKWFGNDDWVIKPALGRVGEDIGLPGTSSAKEWKEIAAAVRKNPEAWVAQRRFTALPLINESGQFYPCIGVYTIDGRAAGAYGRLSSNPLINYKARDVAVLVEGTPIQIKEETMTPV